MHLKLHHLLALAAPLLMGAADDGGSPPDCNGCGKIQNDTSEWDTDGLCTVILWTCTDNFVEDCGQTSVCSIATCNYDWALKYKLTGISCLASVNTWTFRRIWPQGSSQVLSPTDGPVTLVKQNWSGFCGLSAFYYYLIEGSVPSGSPPVTPAVTAWGDHGCKDCTEVGGQS